MSYYYFDQNIISTYLSNLTCKSCNQVQCHVIWQYSQSLTYKRGIFGEYAKLSKIICYRYEYRYSNTRYEYRYR